MHQVAIHRLITKQLRPLTGLNSDRRLFTAVLSAETLDKQNEILVVDELEKVLPIWFARGAPIQDTHTNRSVGKGISFQRIEVQNSGEKAPAILVTGEIYKDYQIDDIIWQKIKSGEYKGVSFGGAIKGDRTPVKLASGGMGYKLTDLEQYEMSVCFLADTDILMADETKKKIIDVKVGDMVIGHDGKAHKVIDVMRRNYKGWIHKIAPAGRWIGQPKGNYRESFRPLCATPEHPFMMKDGTFRQAKELKKGDRVRTAHVVWNKGKFGFRGDSKSAYEQNLNSYQRDKELERIERERSEFEKQGFRFVTIAHHAIPDAVAIKDGKVLAVEVQYGRPPNYKKYLTFKHDYDDVVWIRREDSHYENSVKLGTCRINSTGVKSGFQYDGYVYNLEVEDVHTYVANNFVVHNCKEPANPMSLIVDYNQLAKSMPAEQVSSLNLEVDKKGQAEIHCDGLVCFVEKDDDSSFYVDVGKIGMWTPVMGSYKTVEEARSAAKAEMDKGNVNKYQISRKDGNVVHMVESGDLLTMKSIDKALQSLHIVTKPNDKRPPKKWWEGCQNATGGKDALCGWVFYHKLGGDRGQANTNASKPDFGKKAVEVNPETQALDITIDEVPPEDMYNEDMEFDPSLLENLPPEITAMFLNQESAGQSSNMPDNAPDKNLAQKQVLAKEEGKEEDKKEDDKDKKEEEKKEEMKSSSFDMEAFVSKVVGAVEKTVDGKLQAFEKKMEERAKQGPNAGTNTKEVKPNSETSLDNKPYNNPESDEEAKKPEKDEVKLETKAVHKSYNPSTARPNAGVGANMPNRESAENPILKMARSGMDMSQIANTIKNRERIINVMKSAGTDGAWS